MFCLEPRGGYGFAKIFPLRGIGEWSSECGGLLRVGVAAFYAGKTHSSCASSKGHAPLFPVPNSWASTPPFGVTRLRALLSKTAASCDFGTNSRMPIKRACRSMSLSPNALYIMSGTEGISRLSIRAASSPFMTGMERSINSGRSCWAFSIASFPFSASPHTTRSASRWKRSQSTLRIQGLSSTIRTDLQDWELGDLISCRLWLPFLLRSEVQLRPPLSVSLPCLSHPSTCSQCESPDTDHRLRQC